MKELTRRIALRTGAAAAVMAGTVSADATAAPNADSSFIDPEGTAHVCRVVPVPATVSAEAQKSLGRQVSDAPVKQSLEERRSRTDRWQKGAGEAARQRYPVASVEDSSIAGVPVRVVMPQSVPSSRRQHLLINVHGGGFNSDSGSLTETIPLAHLTQMKVVAVLYRLAPEHPFPAAVDDTIAVYKDALKSCRPENIALYGTSAGAILTAQVAVRLRQMSLPLPGALGVFSGHGDWSRITDSQALFALGGLSGPLEPPKKEQPSSPYAGATDLHDPVLSPLFADLKGMPPSLFMTSTRDLLLSGTTILHRAFLRAKVDASLIVFEALPHAFWNDVHLPESEEAHEMAALFFEKHLSAT